MNAMWKSATPTTMQAMTSTYCNSLLQEQVISLKDSRDNTTYKVAKLKDGKCWMIENLRLVGPKTLTSSDSDVSSNFTLPASSNTDWGEIYDTPYVHKGTESGYTDQVYYNWNAATAGTGTKSLSKGTEAKSSICPKGWRLPIGGETSDSTNEFQKLYTYYSSSSALRATPVPNFTLPGTYYNGYVGYQGSSGTYWSSTSNGSDDDYWYHAYYLSIFSSNTVYTGYGERQYSGLSVRCLAQ